MHHRRTLSPALVAGVALAVGSAVVGCDSSRSANNHNKRELRNAYALEASSLPIPRAEATATLLRSGEVLVVGGVDGAGQPLRTTVLIAVDGVTRPGPDLINSRAGHTATLLEDGQVLVAGGHRDGTGLQGLRATERYDPERGVFEPGPMLAEHRSAHAAQAVEVGGRQQVLLVGGWQRALDGARYLDRLELLDPTSGVSTVLSARLPEPQANVQAALLAGGEVVLSGGTGATGPATTSTFDPHTLAVTPVLAREERVGAAVASVGSCALVIGGVSSEGMQGSIGLQGAGQPLTAAAELTLSAPRSGATATRLGDVVVVAGGRTTEALSELVELIGGCGSSITTWYPLRVPRHGHAAVALRTNVVLLIGGYGRDGLPIRNVEVIDLNQPTPITQLNPGATRSQGPAAPINAPVTAPSAPSTSASPR